MADGLPFAQFALLRSQKCEESLHFEAKAAKRPAHLLSEEYRSGPEKGGKTVPKSLLALLSSVTPNPSSDWGRSLSALGFSAFLLNADS
jgi:hypothetical protein